MERQRIARAGRGRDGGAAREERRAEGQYEGLTSTACILSRFLMFSAPSALSLPSSITCCLLSASCFSLISSSCFSKSATLLESATLPSAPV